MKNKKKCRVGTSVNGKGNGNRKGILLHDFIMNAEFENMEGKYDITQLVRDKLKDIHPSMIIAGGSLKMEMYQVSYTYETRRGNKRMQTKDMYFTRSSLPEEENEKKSFVKKKAMEYFKHYNEENPYRSIKNIIITEIVHFADANMSIA